MKALVGYTGFVGSNIYENGHWNYVYNSKNIKEAYGTHPDLLVYAGLRAEKYLANHVPEKDLEMIHKAEEDLMRISPKKLVLISTIDVFKAPKGVDEHSVVDIENLHPYGYHRYLFEQWVRTYYPDALIIRLPGLFGKNIKKNFIYDMMELIPSMLSEDKLAELSIVYPAVKRFYALQDNGFYKLVILSKEERKQLQDKIKRTKFSALYFTDSRSRYQFYPLKRLWDDIQIGLENGIDLWHPATEPISAAELYEYLTGETFVNELPGIPVDYDYRTLYADIFGGRDGYICTKIEIMRGIKEFINQYEKQEVDLKTARV